jgi:hypothetical protein
MSSGFPQAGSGSAAPVPHQGVMPSGGPIPGTAATIRQFRPLQTPSRHPGPPAYFSAPPQQQQYIQPQPPVYAPPYGQFQAPVFPQFQQQQLPGSVQAGGSNASKNKRKKKKAGAGQPVGFQAPVLAPMPTSFPQIPFMPPSVPQAVAAVAPTVVPVPPLAEGGSALARCFSGHLECYSCCRGES